jgi:hypothetical protein
MRGHTFRPSRGGSLAALDAEDRHDTSCFADEVIIDFPSVAPAVHRIRRAFLAEERSSAVNAAIQLSHREAFYGAIVPLEVPVRCTCHGCGGRGETWTEPCGRCAGSGFELKRHHVRVMVPAGVLDGALFHFLVAPRHTPPTRIELRVLVS